MTTSVIGTVTRVQRLGHTVYGNPIMSVYVQTDDPATRGTYRISDNAGLVYEIDNPEYREAEHTFALTRAGRISHVIKPLCEVCGLQGRHAHYCPRQPGAFPKGGE